MFKGRKVTDPVVHGAATGSQESRPGIAKAWDTVGRARSELREIEQRLVDVERHPPPTQLNQTGETSITDYGGLGREGDNDRTFDISDNQEFASGAVVDNYGRSAYLKSKGTTRKVSRLDGKYTEDHEEKERKQTIKSATKAAATKSARKKESRGSESNKPRQSNFQLRERKYNNEPSAKMPQTKKANEKHVEFSEIVHSRENHMDLTYGIPARNNTTPDSTLTNSCDIRETEINFLNNNLTLPQREADVRWNQAGSKFTHVSVTVPGTAMSSNKYSTADTAHEHRQHFLDLVTGQPAVGEAEARLPGAKEAEGRLDGSDCSQSDSDTSRGRKFRTNIRNIDPDGLARIKETIRKQQQNKSSPRENSDDSLLGATGGLANEAPPPPRLLHTANEPIASRTQEAIEGAEKQPKVRKVAAGPAAPSYKGFSETEVKYRIVDSNKLPKSQDGLRKDKKRQVSIKVQDKRIDPIGNWLAVEDTGERKKISRVIAPSRKPSKQPAQPKKEIITTSSWRAGQELILRELGPAVKTRKSHKYKDTDGERERVESPMGERPDSLVGEEQPTYGVGSATAAELEHHKALSEEARRVYTDLHLEPEEERQHGMEDKDRHWKPPVKRKAPKSSEHDKQQAASAKQRHYDQDEVRRYIQRQKAERIRQQKDDEKRQKDLEETRRRHLEELYNKQKHTAATSKKEKSRSRQGHETYFKPGMTIDDLPRHHPFHKDRAHNFLLSSDSDNKENHIDPDMDVSDGSSTITGDGSMDDLTPTSTPRRLDIDIEAANLKPTSHSSKDSKLDKKLKPKTIDPSANVKTIGDFSFDVAGVQSKFTQALNEKLNEETRALSGNSGYGSSNYATRNINSAFGALNSHGESEHRLPSERADRIRAIKETAATLQSRIQAEARKIQGQSIGGLNNENGATTRPTVRWEEPKESDDFYSRYERVTAANDDFTVFRSNLPGCQPGRRLPEAPSLEQDPQRQQPINAWGSNVPSGASTNTLPSGASSRGVASGGPVNGLVLSSGNDDDNDIDDTSITETSTFSEITMTDESDLSTQRKIGAGLVERDFQSAPHPAGDKSGPPAIPRPASAPQKPAPSWEDVETDHYNVFSIYSRRQQDKIIRPGREPMSKEFSRKKAQTPPNTQPEMPVPAATHSWSPGSRAEGRQSPGAPTGRKSPGTGHRSESPYSQGVSSRSESLRTRSPVDKSKFRSSKTDDKADSDGDNTLGEESYTQSFETEEKTTSRVRSTTDTVPQNHRTLPSRKEVSETDDSMEDFSHDRGSPVPDHSEPAGPPRLSPNSLERRFLAELNQLDSMEMSMKQLTGVERTRAVAMAQQETVSLAQMLKAKQQVHELQMKELQVKAQLEATEAGQQLEDARSRASHAAYNAADMIAKVREEGVSAMQDSTRKLIDTQTEAATATAQAAKFLSEARAYGFQDTNRLAVETAASAAASTVTTAIEKKWQPQRQKTSEKRSQDSARSQSARTTSFPTYKASSSRSSRSASSRQRADDGAGKTGSGAEGHDDSESICSVDDYSVQFDESMTEDEREEKSFRLILPSESHRKKSRHIHSDNESVTSEGSVRNLDDFNSLFMGEENFDKFTDDIVKQFMREEELRAQHQTALLKLRENALMEKTKAEMSWLDQQKHRMRNKGADDNYPQIVKRQRSLKLKLQEQQAEIRRQREANEAAARERQKNLYEEIERKKRQSQTQETKPKVAPAAALPGRLGRPNEVHTEAEVSSIDEASDADRRQRKDYKSDSEIYTEPRAGAKKSRASDTKRVEKYKKIHLDEKFLTHRQHRLNERKKNAEELLKWKKLLDEEEGHIYKLEKKALHVWKKEQSASKKEESEPKVLSRNGTTKELTRTASVTQDTVISEQVTTAKDDSVYTQSVKESIQAASVESSPEEIHRRMLNDKSNLKNQGRSGSESSIPEEMMSQSSIDDSKKLDISSDDTMTNSYDNETFEDTTTTPKRMSKSVTSTKSPLEKLKKMKNLASPRSVFSTRSHTRNSESASESEDSISHADTQSDVSDFEGRIRALNEQLRRRKTEADRLKRDRKKKRKELMKNKEETLKKQIEAYDNQITELKSELQKEMEHEPVKTSVKPQIKQPKVSPKKKTDTTPPKQRRESDSSGPDSTQVSPSVLDDKDVKTPPMKSVILPPLSKASLDRISEGSESKSEKSEPTSHEKHFQKPSSEEPSTQDIDEEIEEVGSEASDDKSQGIKINLGKKDDIYDVSYSEDFQITTEVPDTIVSVQSEMEKNYPVSARDITEQISEQFSEVPASTSEPFFHLGKSDDLEGFIKEDRSEGSDIEVSPRSYSITRSDSRPSSERSASARSDRSLQSLPTEHESSSSSEKSPDIRPDKLDNFLDDEVEDSDVRKHEPSRFRTIDIDDLLGMPEDIEDEATPVPSPRETPRELFDDDNLIDFREMGWEQETRLSEFDTPREDLETQREDIETAIDDLVTPRDEYESPREQISDQIEPAFVDALADFNTGDRVSVTGLSGARSEGILLFKGTVQFAPGIWAGVELDSREGRHDGTERGVQYFRCRPGHGVFVPGHDLLPAVEEQAPEINVRDSMESVNSMVSSIDGEELINLITEADKNVREFDENESPVASPKPAQRGAYRNEHLADSITDHLLQSVVKDDMERIRDIASNKTQERRQGPPVAQKPTRTSTPEARMNGNVEELEAILQEKNKMRNEKLGQSAKLAVDNLMMESIQHMLAIRNNKQDQSNDSGIDPELAPSPTDEIQGVLDKQDEDSAGIEGPVRPGSPIPGLQQQQDSHKPSDSGTFDGEYDDELWTPPNKAPPPYPEHGEIRPEVSRSELQKLTEELFFAVPHDASEVSNIVSSAVDTFWTQRRYGEPMDNVTPPESYFTQEEKGQDLISSSKRVFKKLLFDLTGEVMRDVYKEEEYDSPVPWHKRKRKQNKYYKGSRPPTTVDILKPVVQDAVNDILGLNGTNVSDRGKWGNRKKKDLVDNILVQELREEEPQWVNYDDDELAVKMQLTETIFESLLTDTVQTINKIFRKKQNMARQAQQ